MTGKYGGAAFLFVYLAAVVLLGMPVLIAEIALGRATGKNPVGAFKELRPQGPWKLVGYLGVVAGVMILSYYSLISGWTLGYFFKTLAGGLKNAGTAATPGIFDAFARNFWLQAFLLAAFLFITGYIVARGIANGIEKACKFLMPVLFVIMLILLVRSLTLPGAGKRPRVLSQARFLPTDAARDHRRPGPGLFQPQPGHGGHDHLRLVPEERGEHPGRRRLGGFPGYVHRRHGRIHHLPGPGRLRHEPGRAATRWYSTSCRSFSTRCRSAPCSACCSSCCSAWPPWHPPSPCWKWPPPTCIDERKWSRKKIGAAASGLSFLIGIPSILSFGNVEFFRRLPLIHVSFFEMMDFVWGSLALSVGALFIAIFVGYVWKSANALNEIGQGTKRFRYGRIWSFSVKYLCPLLIVATLFILVIG